MNTESPRLCRKKMCVISERWSSGQFKHFCASRKRADPCGSQRRKSARLVGSLEYLRGQMNLASSRWKQLSLALSFVLWMRIKVYVYTFFSFAVKIPVVPRAALTAVNAVLKSRYFFMDFSNFLLLMWNRERGFVIINSQLSLYDKNGLMFILYYI